MRVRRWMAAIGLAGAVVVALALPGVADPGNGKGGPSAAANTAGSDNGNANGWVNGTNNPHEVAATPPPIIPSAGSTDGGSLAGGAADPVFGSNPNAACDTTPSVADYTGNGANDHGAYDNTCNPPHEPGNGSETGNAVGQPCAGCVGSADNKNPPGQDPDGSDHNAGYECDRNQGVGKENPAHTGCHPTTTTTRVTTTTTGCVNCFVCTVNCGGGTTTTQAPTTTVPATTTVAPPTTAAPAVLGVEFTRPSPSPTEPTKVLGVSFARTGLTLLPYLLTATALVGLGMALSAAGRRRQDARG